MKKNLCIFICAISVQIFAQTPGVTLQTISNYNQWGWNAVVMQNDLVTIATVPVIGGRVMQYDLGSYPSILVNSLELGKTYIPANNNQWHNYGGFKNWPSPQNNWNASGWPPPPILDYGSYTITDSLRTADTVAVTMSSQKEQWFAPNIRFERRATMFTGSSRVKMEQTIINEGTDTVRWALWDITQSIVHHPNQTDYQNYWVYFPLNPNSSYGSSGVSPQGGSNSWKGIAAPGVYGIQFNPENAKIFADPQDGWIAYACLSDTTIFAKTFQILEGAVYPDNNARVTVYVSGATAPLYLEVEVKAPLATLEPNGGKSLFTENWWAARVRAPIVSVDSVGAVADRLSYNTITQTFSGIYGVFYKGTAKLVFIDGNGVVISEGNLHTVSPLTEFFIRDTLTIPNNAKKIEVRVQNSDSDFIGILESVDIVNLPMAVQTNNPVNILDFHLASNFPNPFNPSTTISFTIPSRSFVSLKIFDLLGREIATIISQEMSAGSYTTQWTASKITSGIYLYRLQAGAYSETKKLLLLR